MMFGRRIRTKLDLLHPIKSYRKFEKQNTSNRKLREFKVGENVWMRNYLGNPRWLPGVVTARTGPVSYRICSRGQEQRRHVDQLKKRESSSETETVEAEFAYYPEVVIEEPQERN